MLLTSSMLGPSLPLHKAEFRKSLFWGLVCLLAQRVLLWLENDGSSFKTSYLFVFVWSQYAISLCYECLSKTDHESSIDLCLRLNKASWIEFLVLRLKCLGLIICYSFYKAIFTKAVKGPEFGFTSNIYICFTFLFSLLLSVSLQRTESACSEHHQQTGFHYRSEPWLRSGQHPPCRLETTLCECQWSNKRGSDSQQNCSVVSEKIRTFLVCYVFSFPCLGCVCVCAQNLEQGTQYRLVLFFTLLPYDRAIH